MKENICGPKITLKRLKHNHKTAQEMFLVIDKCRDAFLPWLDWVQNTNSPNDLMEFLQNANNDWDNNKQFIYGIYLNDKFIGYISVIDVSWSNKRAEIGYWLDTDCSGHGYMGEAVQLIENELFENDFNRIIIITDVLNTKSAKVAQHSGYKHDGILRQNTYSTVNKRFRDQNVFSKLKSDIKND